MLFSNLAEWNGAAEAPRQTPYFGAGKSLGVELSSPTCHVQLEDSPPFTHQHASSSTSVWVSACIEEFKLYGFIPTLLHVAALRPLNEWYWIRPVPGNVEFQLSNLNLNWQKSLNYRYRYYKLKNYRLSFLCGTGSRGYEMAKYTKWRNGEMALR